MADAKKFEDVLTPEEMIETLQARAMSIHNTGNGGSIKYVYHYTKMSAIAAIVKSKRWFIGSPKGMNDGLELIHLEDAHADNLFFASFCLDDSENLGMWSMYSQPWEEGILLRIPVEMFKEWVKSNRTIYDADKKTKRAGAKIHNAKVSFHAVAYTNAESRNKKEAEILTCGSSKNLNFVNSPMQAELKGYIKDSAWAYENEYRIRIETDPSESHEAVAIDIPESVLESFEYITGPRFNGNFTALLRNTANPRINPVVMNSLFTGRLNWVYCDSCKGRIKSKSDQPLDAFDTKNLDNYSDLEIEGVINKGNDATRRRWCIELIVSRKPSSLIHLCISQMSNDAEKYKLLEELVNRELADTPYFETILLSLGNSVYQYKALELCVKKNKKALIIKVFERIKSNKFIYQSLLLIYDYDEQLFSRLYMGGECFSNKTYLIQLSNWLAKHN